MQTFHRTVIIRDWAYIQNTPYETKLEKNGKKQEQRINKAQTVKTDAFPIQLVKESLRD